MESKSVVGGEGEWKEVEERARESSKSMVKECREDVRFEGGGGGWGGTWRCGLDVVDICRYRPAASRGGQQKDKTWSRTTRSRAIHPHPHPQLGACTMHIAPFTIRPPSMIHHPPSTAQCPLAALPTAVISDWSMGRVAARSPAPFCVSKQWQVPGCPASLRALGLRRREAVIGPDETQVCRRREGGKEDGEGVRPPSQPRGRPVRTCCNHGPHPNAGSCCSAGRAQATPRPAHTPPPWPAQDEGSSAAASMI